MSVILHFIPRKGANVDPSLDRAIDTSEIWFGRAAENTIQLPDRRVRYYHAVLKTEATGCLVQAAKGATIDVNGRPADQARLQKPGDKVGIGSYTLSLTALPKGDAPLELTLETGESDQPSEAELGKFYTKSFNYGTPGYRGTSWLLSLAILAFMLVLPLVFAPAQRPTSMAPGAPAASRMVEPINLWIVGRMSNGHAAFGSDCGACHTAPFVRVQATACLSCHKSEGQHADPHQFPGMNLANERCESCHHEHKGSAQAIRNDQTSCQSCHSNIKAEAANSTLLNVGDFGTSHPNFAPTVIDDSIAGTTKRVRMGEGTPIFSQSNLRFPHGKHLKPEGIKSPNGQVVMTCQTCHQAEPGGGNMQPVSMEKNCISCHELKFEPKHPEWRLPHGNVQDLPGRILGFYSQAVLNGESFGPERDPLFARPGVEITPEQAPAALARAQAATAMASAVAHSTCGDCHVLDAPPAGGDPLAWTVRPVRQATNFLKKAHFSHGKHQTMECKACHAGINDAKIDEVVLPGIDNCRGCHTGEAGKTDRVASTCVTCHGFHQKDIPILAPKAMDPSASVKPEQHAQLE